MITAAVGEQPLGAADPAAGRGVGVAGVAADVRHHRDAGLEAGQAERQLREDQQRDRRPSSSGLPCCGGQRARPVGDHVGVAQRRATRPTPMTTTLSAR